MKYKIEILVILVISIGLSFILPSFLRGSKTIEVKSISEFVGMFLVVFIALALLFFAYRKPTK